MRLLEGKASERSAMRRGWLVVCGCAALAAVLRCWRFGRLGLTHSDEEVYAFTGLWSLSPEGITGLNPELISYAPPGISVLIGWAYLLLGMSDSAALTVGVVAGIATVPVIAWLAGRTFGPGAGFASSALAALSIANIAFSRKALTDVPFLLAFLIAIGLGGKFLESPSLTRALAFGLGVGAAQNLKYHGWLAGAVIGSAALMGMLRGEGRSRGLALRTFGFGLLAAFVAFACYLPWYLFVERHGGYLGLLRHQRSYLGGRGSWLEFWKIQIDQVAALSGGWGWGLGSGVAAGVAAAVGGSAIVSRVDTVSRRVVRYSLRTVGIAAGLAVVPEIGVWVGVVMALTWLLDERPARRILGCWWVLFLILTPCYHPYARLWLPLHAAGWVTLAGLLDEPRRLVNRPRQGSKRVRFALLIPGLVLINVLALARVQRPSPNSFPIAWTFEPTDDLRTRVANLGALSPVPRHGSPEGLVRLRLLSRRPFAFYLATQSTIRFQQFEENKGLIDGPVLLGEWALVDETQVSEGRAPMATRAEVMRLWEPGERWESTLDPVTLLDVNPRAARTVHLSNKVPLNLLVPRVRRSTGVEPRSPSP